MIRIHKPRFKLFVSKEFFNLALAFKRPQYCYGLQNKLSTYEYIPFFDFDDTDYFRVKNFAEWLYYFNDSKYGYTLLQSSKYNFHLIYWKITVRDVYLHYLIDALAYGLDKGYIQVFLQRGFSVLRISSKWNKPIPKVIEYIMGNKYQDEIIMKKLLEANKKLIVYTTFKY